MTVTLVPPTHSHAWQIAEVEYVDEGSSVRRLECGCGAIDYQPDF